MLIRSRRPWELSERDVTPERLYRNRRQIIAGATGSLAALSLPGGALAEDGAPLAYAPSEHVVDAPSTPYEAISGYNNFWEFGVEKTDPGRHAHSMTTDPWSVTVDGLCGRPGTYSVEDVVDFSALEERIYRHRCVEGWSMVIPWIGTPLGAALARYEPTAEARYVAFETYANPLEMRGIGQRVLDWPYVEGLRMDEAMHPLALMVVGLYGKVLPNQNGAPLRIHIPWKYGFKSIKSIVRITFVADEPPATWNLASPSYYGFYSNVNPNVHPWRNQARERVIGGRFNEIRETEMFNGYGDEVAHLYAGMDLAKFY
jgi:sulfoxide reductase catalytic subunit YedY